MFVDIKNYQYFVNMLLIVILRTLYFDQSDAQCAAD